MTSNEKWQNWIAARNRYFADPAGFLSVTDLVWLTQAPQEIKGLTGSWWADGDFIRVTDSSTGEHSWKITEDSEAMIEFDGIKVELAVRNNQLVVRPRDPKSEMLKTFDGIITFDYNPKFKVSAKLVPFDAPLEITVGSVVEGMTIGYISPGSLEFSIDDETFRLTAFDKPKNDDLVVYFKDATSGSTTYGTGKQVTASYQPVGSYLIDFNFSGNFPCSYTDFATCPVAPAENRLPIAIEAGEKKPIYRNTAAGVISQVS